MADEATAANTSSGEVIAPKIIANNDVQDEADRRNMYRLAAIGVKEGVTAGSTKIVGADVTNPILRTADGTDFKTVDAYSIVSLLKAIFDGADRLEAANI